MIPTAAPVRAYGLEALMSADEHNLGEGEEAVPIRTEHDSLIAATDSMNDDSETFGAVPPTVLESIDMPLLASTDLDVLPMPAALADDLAEVLDPFVLDAVVAEDTEDDVFEEDGTTIKVAEPVVTEAALFQDAAAEDDEDNIAVISSTIKADAAGRTSRAKRGRATRLQATVAVDGAADVRSRMLRHEQRARDAPPLDKEVAAAMQRARPRSPQQTAADEVDYDEAVLQAQHSAPEEGAAPAVEDAEEQPTAFEVLARDEMGNVYEPVLVEEGSKASAVEAAGEVEEAAVEAFVANDTDDVEQRREAVHAAYAQRVAAAEEAAVKLQALAAELATPEALQRELASLEAARLAAAGIDPLPTPAPVAMHAAAEGAPGTLFV